MPHTIHFAHSNSKRSWFVNNRVYGSYDLQFGFCIPEHILKERDEWEIS